MTEGTKRGKWPRTLASGRLLPQVAGTAAQGRRVIDDQGNGNVADNAGIGASCREGCFESRAVQYRGDRPGGAAAQEQPRGGHVREAQVPGKIAQQIRENAQCFARLPVTLRTGRE